MYEDAILDLVSDAIPVYHREKPGDKPKTRPEGHFVCTKCPGGPRMGSTRRYVTARIMDFKVAEADKVKFTFLYSPQDQMYADAMTKLTAKLARATHDTWLYSDGRTWNEQRLAIRGYWHNDKFVHDTKKILMGEHYNIQLQTDHEDGDWWPEAAIMTFKPAANGAYFDTPDLGKLGGMDRNELREHMQISGRSSLATASASTGWLLHERTTVLKGKPKKKKKTEWTGLRPQLPEEHAAEFRQEFDDTNANAALIADQNDRVQEQIAATVRARARLRVREGELLDRAFRGDRN